MKILTVCDQGNNRSVTLGHQLKYMGNDVIPVGLETNSTDTLNMLYQWADRIITTERVQNHTIPQQYQPKVRLWEIGPDIYKRPFNPDLLAIVRQLIESHKHELQNGA